jgi:glycosyltransferase involved in cell wall biosynthesis
VPAIDGYRVDERFYRRSAARGLQASGRVPFKAAEHLRDMLRFRRDADADLIHYQWLTVPALDSRLLPSLRPRVMTAHYILPPDPSRRQVASARRVFGRMDAVIAHSEHGAGRLRDEVGLDPARVRVIPHGAFDYLTRLAEEKPLPAELEGAEGPVILCFGLLRPYKGIEGLLEAFGHVQGAELWVVGNPRMEVEPLRKLAAASGGRVRFLTRFVEDAEIPAIFRRADLLALPYLDAEHSGVLYTGLAFGKPMVLSAVGGFPEVAATGAARLVPAGDPAPPPAPSPGRRRPAAPSTSIASCSRPADEHRRRRRLLALRLPDRLHPRRLPAGPAGPARPAPASNPQPNPLGGAADGQPDRPRL